MRYQKSIEFLVSIFEQQCQEGDFIFLSVKGPDVKWRDIALEYNDDLHTNILKTFRKYPPTEFDLYWSPMPYSDTQRTIENVTNTKFLAQDIDERSDPDEVEPKPSYIWESSPNKYQGLWELDRYIEAKEYGELNKSLASHIGCDSCFDLTHVYRIPGTFNHKYKNKPEIGLPDKTKEIYKPKTLSKIVGHRTKKKETKSNDDGNITERKIYARYDIPQKVRDLLAMEDISGIDRSGTIWYVENKLHELGMSPNEIITLIKNSEFNKYKGRNDEIKRLKEELNKIISGDISEDEKGEDFHLKVSSYQNVMANSAEFAGWLVKGFWGRNSHGIVAGMPKCFKSTIVHDLVVSVASGKPFLGKYPVIDPGPVVVVQNENADYVMKDRTEKLIAARGVAGRAKVHKNRVHIKFPPDLPIHFMNQQGFMLTEEDHRKQLEELIAKTQPVLVVLDPLYLMFDEDLNLAKDLSPILNWLLHLKNKYHTSIMVIHHYRKDKMGDTKGGVRMMGSIILYGWVESAWYLSKESEENNNITDKDPAVDQTSSKPAVVNMSREFRMAGQFPDIDLHIKMGEIGKPTYHVDVTLSGDNTSTPDSINDAILNALRSSNVPLTRAAICERLGMNKSQVKDALDLLFKNKKIVANNGGFTVYKR